MIFKKWKIGSLVHPDDVGDVRRDILETRRKQLHRGTEVLERADRRLSAVIGRLNKRLGDTGDDGNSQENT